MKTSSKLAFLDHFLLCAISNGTILIIIENLRFSIPEWQAFKTVNLVSSKLMRVNYHCKMVIKLTF